MYSSSSTSSGVGGDDGDNKKESALEESEEPTPPGLVAAIAGMKIKMKELELDRKKTLKRNWPAGKQGREKAYKNVNGRMGKLKKKINEFEKEIKAKALEWKKAEIITKATSEVLTRALEASKEVQATEDVQKVISELKNATIVVATKTINEQYEKHVRIFEKGGGGKTNNNKTDSKGSKNTPVILAAFAMGILIIEIMRLHNCTFDQAWEIHLKKKSSKTSMHRYVNFAHILTKFNVVGICKWIQCNWSYLSQEIKCLTSKVSNEYPPPLEVALREFSESNDVSAFRTEETTSSSSSTSTSSSNGVGDDDDDDYKMSINDDSDDGDDGDDSDEESASKKRKRGEEETSAAKKAPSKKKAKKRKRR